LPGKVVALLHRREVLGQFVVSGPLKWLGWLTTALMAAAVVAMAVTAIV
jgi:hypothetical protein